MSKKEKLLALADRIEKLDGSSREMDAYIALELLLAGDNMLVDRFATGWCVGGTGQPYLSLPYTASLDAAMQLVPSHMVVNMGNDGRCWSHVWHDTQDYNGVPHDSAAASLALAVTASALRARAALEDA